MDTKDKNDSKQITRHHRKPRKLGGTSEARNISHITREKHEAWHLLVNHQDIHEICRIINETFIDPDYLLVPVKKILQ